jgi:heme exporter protein D
MNLGPHAPFIMSAYVVAIAIVVGLIVWVVLDRRQLTRMLDALEAQGLTRRSGRTGEETRRTLERG